MADMGYCSMVINSSTRTDPYWQTFPRSFRSRSTNMTCSARSLGLAKSSARMVTSCDSPFPLGLVPAMGLVLACEPVNRTSRSGELLTRLSSGNRTSPAKGEGFTRRRRL